jgi:arylsulfatase A-like enzyme
VVVVVTDDMRAADWRALPRTKELVGGEFFEQFTYPTPLCGPSRATLLTGRYAHNHGVLMNAAPQGGWRRFRDDERATLAPALRAVGYRTALFGKYVNGWDGSSPPPGWDEWHPAPARGDAYHPPGRKRPYLPDRQGKDVTAFAASVPADRPLFLWYAPLAPHRDADGNPPVPAPRHRDAFPDAEGLDRRRLQSLLAVDEAVAGIAAAMGPRWDAACVFVLSDNGWEMGEHGTVGKATPYDGSVRVPLLARFPGLAGAGRLAAAIDLAPTIARIAGTDLPGADGRALQDAWEREAVLLEGWGKRARPHGFVGVRTRHTTYVERPDGARERYDRRTDPQEQDDLIVGGEAAPEQAHLAALRGCAGESCRRADGRVTPTAPGGGPPPGG